MGAHDHAARTRILSGRGRGFFCERSPDPLQHHLQVEGLGQVVENPILHGGGGGLDAALGGHENQWRRISEFLDLLQQVQPRPSRHVDVADDEIGPLFPDRRDGRPKSRGPLHAVPTLLQRHGDHLADRQVIVNHQDSCHASLTRRFGAGLTGV